MNRLTRIVAAAGVAGALALLTACGGTAGTGGATVPGGVSSAPGVDPNAPEANPPGDIPDNQAFVPYIPAAGGFTVSVPEGWGRTDAPQGVLFTDKLNSIRIETLAAERAPTVDSARTGDLPAIARNSANFEPGKVETLTRNAGEAVHLTYRADAAPDPVTGRVGHDDVERYEFWRDGTEVVLTLAGPQGADNVDPWRLVTDSFAWQS